MSLFELRRLAEAAKSPGLHFGLAVFGEAGEVHSAELASIRRAGPRRRAEFLAGRCAARRALNGLGMGDATIPADFDALRAADPEGALAARLSLRATLQAAFAEGRAIIGFDRAQVAYLLG